MEERVKMGKDSATGSFTLFIGKITATLVLGIGSIIVGIFIDPTDYGLYTVAMIPASTFLLFQDWGVGSALTKYCANYRAAQREGELRSIIASGLAFATITGLFLTLLSLLAANFIASTIFGNPASTFLIILGSFTIFSSAILGVSLSVFYGFERMKLGAVTMIVSAVIQGLLSPLLVYLGFGAFGALLGLVIGSGISAITSVALLHFAIYTKLPIQNVSIRPQIFQTLKPLLVYGIPLYIGTIIAGISTQVNGFLMASFVDKAVIGNYKIASNFATFLTFFTFPIITVLFPAFSKIDPTRDRKLLKTVFASSVKYSSLFLVPATMSLMVLSTPLINTIYRDKWPFAPLFLTLTVMANVVVLFGSLSYSRLLVATGETRMLMKIAALSVCIAVPLAFLVIPVLGVLGVIVVDYLSGTLGLIIGIYWTWKRYETKADLRNSARILLASLIPASVTYIFLSFVSGPAWMMLVIGAALFLTIYIFSIPMVGAVSQMDIRNLRTMFSGLGPVSKLMGFLLTLIETPIKLREKRYKIHEG
jgi:O-antigen/teichoic acid export membrane protein